MIKKIQDLYLMFGKSTNYVYIADIPWWEDLYFDYSNGVFIWISK